jgi:D-alanyl-D-alanine carboxypeptidase
MFSSFLTILLTLSQIITPVAINQPKVVNEAIKFEQIKNFPQSLGIKITAKSALVIDADSGQILFQKNSQQVLPIASLTKLMTALVLLDLNPDWQKEVEYSAEDYVFLEPSQSKIEPAQLKFEVGEKIKIKDLFAAALIKSANNAVKTLVRHSQAQINPPGQTGALARRSPQGEGGSSPRESAFSPRESAFIEKMNQKAKELGMTKTVFVEPTGIDFKNVSTAEDLAKLIKVVSEKLEIIKFLTQKTYQFSTYTKNGQSKFYQIKNTNKLLDSFIKIKAAKTGYLDEAGYCFAGLIEYNKRKLIVVLLGSQSEENRIQEVKGLTYWATTLNKPEVNP